MERTGAQAASVETAPVATGPSQGEHNDFGWQNMMSGGFCPASSYVKTACAR